MKQLRNQRMLNHLRLMKSLNALADIKRYLTDQIHRLLRKRGQRLRIKVNIRTRLQRRIN